MHTYSKNFLNVNLSKPLILDGPMGTRLIELGCDLPPPLWSANALIYCEKTIELIYKNYINAGADILRTNTFRTNPYIISKASINFSSQELIKKAVQIVRDALNTSEKKIFIAGSNAPAEDCYQPFHSISKIQLENNHFQHIELLMNNGVDFILNETFGLLDEIILVCSFCNRNKIPYGISLLINKNGKLLDNSDLVTVLNKISEFEPLFISINCVIPEIVTKYFQSLLSYPIWGIYVNLGKENYSAEKLERNYTSEKLSDFYKLIIPNNPLLIGVCCGGNEDDIKLLRTLIDNYYD